MTTHSPIPAQHSLRTRLIVGTTAAALVVFAAASIILFIAIRSSLLAEVDGALLARAQVITPLIEQNKRDKKTVRLDKDVRLDDSADLNPDPFILQLATGEVIAKTASAGTIPIQLPPPADGARTFLQLPTGHRYRQITLRYQPPALTDERPAKLPAPNAPAATRRKPREDDDEQDPPIDNSPTTTPPTVVITVFRDTAPFDEKLYNLALLLAGVFGGTALLSAGILALIVRRGLRPLSTVAEKIRRLDQPNLTARLDLPTAPAEIQPVIARLNELLARLEASFSRERSFTADVAHELRTPLAGLTAALEVSAAQPRSPQEYHLTLTRCLDVSRHMRTMVENLLTLARADAGQLPTNPEPLNPAQLAAETFREFHPRLQQRNLTLHWSFPTPPSPLPPDYSISTDRTLLTIILRNLFDNATSHANPGGSLSITLTPPNPPATPSFTFTITNSGSQIPAHDAPKLFDRFYRGDPSRNPAGHHCGLGLSLCQRCAALLHASLEITTTQNGPFTATLKLPANPQPNAPSPSIIKPIET